jgi:hypothetical protein
LRVRLRGASAVSRSSANGSGIDPGTTIGTVDRDLGCDASLDALAVAG